ncbi:DoxX family protein [Pararhodobacter marinus]|uniref:LysR family transcriptional regulator n=1 Tax=Pararhodobacter marinus TaxID=2184063 RepID=A0A2U2C8J7_9RHOB|nr:DoxX family protein [Pararhodobacter marinus]PWE28179.1 LysR family transcriptional regulator [Pararhodobacter marinus]
MTTATASDLSAGKITNAELAALILRVSMGVLFILHGWMKYSVFTPAGTAQYFAAIGLPAFLGYVTIAAEILGGAALIAGLWTRWVSVAFIPLMIGAGYFGHGANGFFFSNEGGGWEYTAFWTIVLVVQALLGGGAWALRRD